MSPSQMLCWLHAAEATLQALHCGCGGALNSGVSARCSCSAPNIHIMGSRAYINKFISEQSELASRLSFEIKTHSTQRIIHVSSSTAIPLERTVIHSLDEIVAQILSSLRGTYEGLIPLQPLPPEQFADGKVVFRYHPSSHN